MRRKSTIILLLMSLFAGSCRLRPQTAATPIGEPASLIVFAAASLTDAFQELAGPFEAAHTGVTVSFNFAGSQALRTQIEEGAQADVFASANPKEMETLEAAGSLSGPARTFATNVLTIIVAPNNPAGIGSPQDLAKPGVKLVLAAEEVPAGGYARQALANLAALYGATFPEAVLQNVVSNEDTVRQVVAKVQLGEADAGIVYATDAVARDSLGTVALPEAQNVVAEYPIAVLAESRNQRLASEFGEFILSPEGQDILRRWGFGPPP